MQALSVTMDVKNKRREAPSSTFILVCLGIRRLRWALVE